MNAWSVPGYREVRELGAGGAGRVVLATYMTTGAYVAIKYLREELRRDRRFLAGFRHEARIMVELNDPNIVRLYEYVEARDGAAIVMELVDGVSLRRILGEHGSTSPEAALVVLKGSLAGLSAAHATGIVHRDYKPENVLIQADGNSKLSDFGIATPSGSPETSAGTPPYMAPEQWYGGPAGPAADVYAATCVFYECLTGRRPYRADDLTALRMLHRSAPIPAADVPGSVRGLVTRGMAKNPADRPPTARAFIADLEIAATAAYGSDWEQRGRRHLAELATLLALTFPLAAPAEPVEASTSLARTVLSERLARFAPRFAIGAAVLSAVVIAAVVAANRQTPVARDTLLTPPPHSAPAALPPAPDSAGTAAPAAPDETVPGETVPGETSEAATGPAGAGPDENAGTTPPDLSGTPVASVSTGPAAPPGPSGSQGPSGPQGSATPSHMGATASPAPARVTDLGIAAFDGQAVTVDVRASTAARVQLTARFASGPSPDALAAAPSQTVGLRGATSYHIGLQQPFPSPACGTTVYRRVEVSTVPAARGGTRTHTRKLTGPACPAPAVEGVAIDDWDGKRAAVTVRTSGKGPVGVSSVFTRDGRTAASDTRTLSGHTSYSFTVPAGLGAVECGRRAVFGVRVTTDPADPGGPRQAEVRVASPRCPNSQESPSGPAKESPGPAKDPSPATSPAPPESRRPESRSSEPKSPEQPDRGQRSPDPQDSPPPPMIS
ncbi:serine/threonine-protein kinase [Microbispora bryophytorum]|uniref:non-specific serine/threonine protein kinase n=1 Tax=Microbispora bryophytorum subsp. camponoti TaxID=1677852 RepID=A0ABR8KZQ9_9ACTN|nr:serine/threonine-protein kinase [Microbispora camponoti]MBD3144216.1 protein kinase [Microbispora camponoti]